ncbi:MAG: carboxypeptidase, partial [Brachybacterium sp.]|nr:carboxypeptidase [Brachybacterium sp.]
MAKEHQVNDRREPMTETDAPTGGEDEQETAPRIPADNLSVTAHTLDLDGESIEYTATTGTYVLREEPGGSTYTRAEPYAEVFSVSYVRTTGEEPSTRPVVFAFNGGPGASTVWLHLGILGPRRVEAPDAGEVGSLPAGLTDNAETILREADLVCIDAMTTGYSRPSEGTAPGRMHGFTEDRDLIAAFIIEWLTRNDRWQSPKYLAGESYGTTRGAAIAARLMDRYFVAVNGLLLIAPVLDMGTIVFSPGNDAPYIHYLPTYAAIAHAHGKHPGVAVEQIVDEAEAFAEQEYPQLLAQGHRLGTEDKRDAAERIAGLIGVDADWVERADLRPEHQAYLAELLRPEGRVVGRIDGRFSAPAGNANAERMETDPSIDQLAPAYTTAINDYLRRDLQFRTDVVYEIMSGRVHPWSYKDFENRSVEVATDLARTMRKVPQMRVFVAHGYTDAATPFHASEYVLAHLAIPREDYEERIRICYYESGHMMYVHE